MTDSDHSISMYDRHYHLLRRLHSLTGIVPIGVFLCLHLTTNGSMAFGPEVFTHEINFIYSLPGLLALEVLGIWLPLAFHAALGMVYIFTSHPNNSSYKYASNFRYTLMRVSGMIALLFIIVHISTTRWGWSYGGWIDTPFDKDNPVISTAQALQVYWWMPWFYSIGVAAVVFHFANGLWTTAITWGLTVSSGAQKRWGYICTLVGIGLFGLGLTATWSFATYDIQQAQDTESKMVDVDQSPNTLDTTTEFALEHK